MMAGIKALRKIQLGKESVSGTPVAATTIWRGIGTIEDQREKVYPEEQVGILGGTNRSYVARTWGELAMPSVEATFEQLPYIFEAGVAAEVPTQDGAGTDYIYNYLAPTTSQNTFNTYTIEGGDDQQAEEFDYCFVSHFNLSGDGQGAMMVSSDWIGRSVGDTTFTAALSIPDVEEILVNSATLFIDDSGGTVGTTEVSDTLFSLDLDWTTGLSEYWAVDGELDFSLVKFTEDEITLTMTYEHNASAVAEKAKYRSDDIRLFRLLFEGSAVQTPGTTYSVKTMIIDLAGKYEEWGPLDDNEGNDTYEVTVRVRYSVTDALKADVTIVNELSALP
jgi:hypothetical protein